MQAAGPYATCCIRVVQSCGKSASGCKSDPDLPDGKQWQLKTVSKGAAAGASGLDSKAYQLLLKGQKGDGCHLAALDECQAAGFAGDARYRAPDLTQAVLGVVPHQASDEGGFAHPRGAMHEDHKGGWLIIHWLPRRHCIAQPKSISVLHAAKVLATTSSRQIH